MFTRALIMPLRALRSTFCPSRSLHVPRKIPGSTAINNGGRGLLDFFDHEKGWYWRDNEINTGRAWTCAELRNKSFEDLHALWWVCIKEKNLLLSQREEAWRFKVVFPYPERMNENKRTMRNIKLVVWERRIAYMQAQAVAERVNVQRNLYDEELQKYLERTSQGGRTLQADAADGQEFTEAGGSTPDPATDAPAPRKAPEEVVRRVEAEMKRLFPIPIHEIGRKEAAVQRLKKMRNEREQKAMKYQCRKSWKARRWYIL